tara:strand:- start:5067 stop:5642 length:576 start_codon:yes stop_codon:yes gene_type:complete
MWPVINANAVDGSGLADYLNDGRSSILSWHSGATEPPYAVTYMPWMNTTDGEPHIKSPSGDMTLVEFMTGIPKADFTALGWLAGSADKDEGLANLGLNIKPVAAAQVNGATPAISYAHNFASVVRTSTGVATISFDTAEPDANYIPLATPNSGAAATAAVQNKTTTGFEVVTTQVGTLTNLWFWVLVFRII